MRSVVAYWSSWRLRWRARRVRCMVMRSSASRCGLSDERRSWSARREKRSLADSTDAGFRPRKSMQRNAKAFTSSLDREFPMSNRRLWKSISCNSNKQKDRLRCLVSLVRSISLCSTVACGNLHHTSSSLVISSKVWKKWNKDTFKAFGHYLSGSIKLDVSPGRQVAQWVE